MGKKGNPDLGSTGRLPVDAGGRRHEIYSKDCFGEPPKPTGEPLCSPERESPVRLHVATRASINLCSIRINLWQTAFSEFVSSTVLLTVPPLFVFTDFR